MKRIQRASVEPWARAARVGAAGALLSGVSGVVGCLDRPIASNEPRTTSTVVERLGQSAVDKIDILLAIDNSGSMADKQDILAEAVPDLVERLVNPRCVDAQGTPDPNPSYGPNDDCPAGMKREFKPVLDIHIGIISSSLGSSGTTVCAPKKNSNNNDAAHLIVRNPRNPEQAVPTYQGKGFLAWDPSQKIAGDPGRPDQDDGEADLVSDTDKDQNDTALLPTLQEMVRGVGQVGCGFEAQLESWYRFLVDPDPYASIEIVDGKIVTEGTDKELLQQRKDFLRSDSLLAIIVLSDENDCSLREEGEFWKAFDDGRRFTPDPREDPVNLRCWDQERRFGWNALYPTERYRKALTEDEIIDRRGNKVPNPVFSDLTPEDENTSIRGKKQVFFAGIVGVPWQDIARQNEAGQPDVLNGLKDGKPVGGFKTAEELAQAAGGHASVWDIILGDPASGAAPADPHMHESNEPREGQNPITKTSIAPTTAANGTNPINGHEWTPRRGDDLQYACVFDLPESARRDCGNDETCDCNRGDDNPLCEASAANGGRRTAQVRAKAYPGLRHLELLKALGSQGIVGSVCPVQLADKQLDDFGYRPAMGAIVDQLKTALNDQCLPRQLTPDQEGQVACLVIEAYKKNGQCDCNSYPAREEVASEHAAATAIIYDELGEGAPDKYCVCEVQQLREPNALSACQNDVTDDQLLTSNGNAVDGWCYVDPGASVGASALVDKCPVTERRILRFVGKGEARLGATQFITCSGE